MTSSKNHIHAAILGASGYTGMELVRLLCTHPRVTITALCLRDPTKWPLHAPHIAPDKNHGLPQPTHIDRFDGDGCDVVFSCLPHGVGAKRIAALIAADKTKKKSGAPPLRVIDLSADMRLSDPDVYRRWYGVAHGAPHLLDQAVYGLSEHRRPEIEKAFLIANPGCYPTCALLALTPLCTPLSAPLSSPSSSRAGTDAAPRLRIDPKRIIINAVSGLSGAGRTPKQETMLCEASIAPYALSGHRHLPEIEGFLNTLSHPSGSPKSTAHIDFIPHVAPMRRGMCATIHTTLTEGTRLDDLRHALTTCYRHAPFVTILDEGAPPPATDHVLASNHCRIGLWPGRDRKSAILVSVIDNLGKGAAGQAVQNMNIMFSLAEDTGLRGIGLHP